MSPEKYWDDAQEGDECVSPTYTVTKERILAYADLTGDHTPVHVLSLIHISEPTRH